MVVPEGYEAYVLYAWATRCRTDRRSVRTRRTRRRPGRAGRHAPRRSTTSAMVEDPRCRRRTDCSSSTTSTPTTGSCTRTHETWTAEKVAKSQAAHGVSVVEARVDGGRWTIVRPSRYAARHPAPRRSACRAPAGDAAMRTRDDASGLVVLGTINNCAHGGVTPGDLPRLRGELQRLLHQRVSAASRRSSGDLASPPRGFGYRWHEFDERFDAAKHRAGPTAGWVVEVDPVGSAVDAGQADGTRPSSTRARRSRSPPTAVVVYMRRRALRGTFTEEFVSSGRYRPGDREANRALLDEGSSPGALRRRQDQSAGCPLVHGQGPLTGANRYAKPGRRAAATRAQPSDALRDERWTAPVDAGVVV
ncbi:MAG: DUF839 domain-containing protein [Betaproteobacteria bacterium]|nr:DUF839 domain-containing protein [Betaproteobacteria bacterium]